MAVVFEHSLSVDDYNSLRESVGWQAFPEGQARTGLNNSAYIVAAKLDGNAVGMARVITDGGYSAFIVDVIVKPEHQGKGIGKAMLQMIMTHLRKCIAADEKVFVGLMAAKGKEDFYKKFGFLERPNNKMGAGMCQWIKGEPV